jgi:hypothetical protein
MSFVFYIIDAELFVERSQYPSLQYQAISMHLVKAGRTDFIGSRAILN